MDVEIRSTGGNDGAIEGIVVPGEGGEAWWSTADKGTGDDTLGIDSRAQINTSEDVLPVTGELVHDVQGRFNTCGSGDVDLSGDTASFREGRVGKGNTVSPVSEERSVGQKCTVGGEEEAIRGVQQSVGGIAVAEGDSSSVVQEGIVIGTIGSLDNEAVADSAVVGVVRNHIGTIQLANGSDLVGGEIHEVGAGGALPILHPSAVQVGIIISNVTILAGRVGGPGKDKTGQRGIRVEDNIIRSLS